MPILYLYDMNFCTKHYIDITKEELYRLLQLRSAVFVVEQNCPYQDVDNMDQSAYHIFGTDNDNQLTAYCRILPPGARYNEPCISRVATDLSVRRTGWGKPLMEYAINETLQIFDSNSIRISAQLYLKKFYESLGFQQVSEQYLEDDIPHIEMLLSKDN